MPVGFDDGWLDAALEEVLEGVEDVDPLEPKLLCAVTV